jgi:succinyl-CoA synthetase alpha subunit
LVASLRGLPHASHPAAIVGGAEDTAQAKKRILAECGIAVSETPADMAVTLLKAMGKL